jgi:NTE family protein
LHIIRPYLIDPKPFLKIFKHIFREKCFSDCKIPFCATSVDLIKGELVLFDDGLIYKGIIASCALPGLFPPFRMGEKLLVDGGVLMPMPVMAIKEKNTFVIGVNLERLEQTKPQIKNAMDILFTSDKIRYKRLLQYNIDEADFLLYPSLEDFQWLDFDKIRELVKLGEEFTLEHGDQLLKEIRGERVKNFFYRKIPFLSKDAKNEDRGDEPSPQAGGE